MNKGFDFASRISYELKRAERYRVFLSLVVFNIGPIVDMAGMEVAKTDTDRETLIGSFTGIIRDNAREIDFVSNSGNIKIGVLMPETSRQGAEAAARRIADNLQNFCQDTFPRVREMIFPVEISSFPDTIDGKPISSYATEFHLA